MYKPVIGLEIHTQLKTESKMFCSCPNRSSVKEPNINICPVCLGHPGTLPVINEEAVKKVLEVGMALDCELRDVSRFDRKNYFYPDLPKGYQISQDRRPLCYEGFLDIKGKRVRIKRIHLEEDTGKLFHDEKEQSSLVDFNRAGIPLMELVTEPDIRSGYEAYKFAEELQLIFRYLEISDANMQEGQMRVEVNISISHMEGRLGTKVEIKNLNSFRAVQRAVDYEIKRQSGILENGKHVLMETRGWNEKKEETFAQREKEEAFDYRYFPEPDLPPMYLNDPPFNKQNIKLKTELPQKKRERFKNEYGIEEEKEMEVFIADRDLADYFERIMSETLNWTKEWDEKSKVQKREKNQLTRLVVNYLLTDFLGLIKEKTAKDTLITSENFAELIMLVYKKEISSKMAKDLLKEMHETGGDPSQIIEEKGLSQIKNTEEAKSLIKEVIEENSGAVIDYKEGKKEALQFLVGKVMAKTKGRLDPEKALDEIKKIID